MPRYSVCLVTLFWLAGCTPAPEAPEQILDMGHYVAHHSQETSFEHVREDLQLALENRGLVIDATSYIHDMLERTGADLDMTTPIFTDAMAFSFCSALLSRRTMEADVHNIAFCPYVLTVYTPVDEPERVYVAYRRLPMTGDEASDAALAEVEALLDDIAREALGL